MAEVVGAQEEPLDNIEVTNEEKIFAKLDQLGGQVDWQTIRDAGLISLGENRSRFADIGYDIDLVNNAEKHTLYLSIGTEIIQIPTDDENTMTTFYNNLHTVLSYKGTLAITGDMNERTIVEVDGLFDTEITPKAGTAGNTTLQANHPVMIENNNKIEEIYKFTQKVKGVPEIDWQVLSDKILASGESPEDFFKNMGHEESAEMKRIKVLLSMKQAQDARVNIQDFQDEEE